VINEQLLRATGLPLEDLAEVERRESAEVEARALRFRGDREPVALRGRTVILVDDGIATGSTMAAACQVARAGAAAWVVVAVPVGSENGLSRAGAAADEIVCLHTPSRLSSVGEWYRDFSQTSDREVVRLLHLAVG
jgi:predicted phosphoribosyltransferase